MGAVCPTWIFYLHREELQKRDRKSGISLTNEDEFCTRVPVFGLPVSRDSGMSAHWRGLCIRSCFFFPGSLEGREWLISENAEEVSCQCRKGMNCAAKLKQGK